MLATYLHLHEQLFCRAQTMQAMNIFCLLHTYTLHEQLLDRERELEALRAQGDIQGAKVARLQAEVRGYSTVERVVIRRLFYLVNVHFLVLADCLPCLLPSLVEIEGRLKGFRLICFFPYNTRVQVLVFLNTAGVLPVLLGFVPD